LRRWWACSAFWDTEEWHLDKGLLRAIAVLHFSERARQAPWPGWPSRAKFFLRIGNCAKEAIVGLLTDCASDASAFFADKTASLLNFEK
jgi:hypothetical protein